MKQSKNHILMIEDEEHIALGLKLHLEKDGHRVEWADDGEKGIQLWLKHSPDLIILDLMLPKKDGLEVLKEIRQKDKKLPVLILSAKGSTFDKVKALRNGVDDYLAKPFDAQELLLRIHRLLEKKDWFKDDEKEAATPDLVENNYEFSGHKICFDLSKAVHRNGDVIQLTEQEVKLLKVLVEGPNRPLTRAELLKTAWGYQEEIETRTLDNFIVRFRKYFEDNPKKPRHFKSIRSVGYLFDPTGKN